MVIHTPYSDFFQGYAGFSSHRGPGPATFLNPSPRMPGLAGRGGPAVVKPTGVRMQTAFPMPQCLRLILCVQGGLPWRNRSLRISVHGSQSMAWRPLAPTATPPSPQPTTAPPLPSWMNPSQDKQEWPCRSQNNNNNVCSICVLLKVPKFVTMFFPHLK